MAHCFFITLDIGVMRFLVISKILFQVILKIHPNDICKK